MVGFLFFNICYFIVISLGCYLGHVRKVSIMLVFGVSVVFFAPIWYMFLGGEKYKQYTLASYDETIFIGTLSLILVLFYMILHSLFSVLFINNKEAVGSFQYDKLYYIIYSILAIYVVYYISSWPLLNLFSSTIVDRPDIVKSVFVGYFIFSVIVNVVMPSLCLLYILKQGVKKKLKIIMFITLLFLLLLGGNKGVLMYFFIFCVVFVWKNIKFTSYLAIAFFCIAVYGLMRLPYLQDGVSVSYLFESILERIFITQGMSIPNLIELSGTLDITALNSNDLKYKLFEFVYGYSPGSMPIYYTAEIYVRYGISVLLLLGGIFSLFLSLFCSYFESKKNIGINWVLFMFLYVLVMSGISMSSLYIYVFSFFWIFTLSFISKINNNS